MMAYKISKSIRRVRALLGERNAEQIASILHMANNFRVVELNIKAFGYDLGKRLAEALPVREDTVARHVGLLSKTATQIDIESDWVAHWARQIGSAVIYHRKLWELTYILQAIYEHGHMQSGARGLGFGCGVEPIPSVLAAHGVAVTVTDLASAEAEARGWIDRDQHSRSLEDVYHEKLVDRAQFDALVDHREVNMKDIPSDLNGFDFCWSTCAFEHLGSIDAGLDFVVKSLETVRPGGLAVHTTEFNVDDDRKTIEYGETVLFQRKHMEELAKIVRDKGHDVAALDFDFGDRPMDQFIDIPPYGDDGRDMLAENLRHPRHLKLSIAGHVSTCFGIIIRKAR